MQLEDVGGSCRSKFQGELERLQPLSGEPTKGLTSKVELPPSADMTICHLHGSADGSETDGWLAPCHRADDV